MRPWAVHEANNVDIVTNVGFVLILVYVAVATLRGRGFVGSLLLAVFLFVMSIFVCVAFCGRHEMTDQRLEHQIPELRDATQEVVVVVDHTNWKAVCVAVIAELLLKAHFPMLALPRPQDELPEITKIVLGHLFERVFLASRPCEAAVASADTRSRCDSRDCRDKLSVSDACLVQGVDGCVPLRCDAHTH